MSDLDDELAQYRTLAFLTQRAMERALSNPFDEYIRELPGFPRLGKQKADGKEIIKEYFDSVKKSPFDQYLLRLVAAFERLAFLKLENAVGIASGMLGKYPPESPFSRAAKKFVKDAKADFKNLADIEELLKSYPQSTSKDLEELRLHRNWVAHAGRLGERSTFSKIEDVHKALADLLSVI